MPGLYHHYPSKHALLVSIVKFAMLDLLERCESALAEAGPSGAVLAENFPTRVRTKAIGFAYSIFVAVFGGTAPYLNALFNSMDLGWLSGAYVMVLCVCTAVACFMMKETKGIDLKDA